MRFLAGICLVLNLSSCSRPPDLNTPCPDYGRFCPQILINDDASFE
ncbi:T4SS-associated protein LvhB7 [Legionella longbeachae]|nr:Legionella vir-like protein LvhB7 [Legionella longbeachae D-4968]